MGRSGGGAPTATLGLGLHGAGAYTGLSARNAAGAGRNALCNELGRGIKQVHRLYAATGGCMRHPGRCSSRFVVRGTGHTLLLPLFWLIIAHAHGAECV